MELIKKQKPPVLIAGALGIVGVLAIALYMTVMRGPDYTVLAAGSNMAQLEAWEWKLNSEKIRSEIVEDASGRHQLKVLSVNADKAKKVLSGTRFQARSASITSPCEKPGQFATRAMMDAFSRCETEHKIRDQLVSMAGILEAKVLLVESDSGQLLGPETESQVTVTVFLDGDAQKPVDGRVLASKISNMAEGVTLSKVYISDSDGNTLWNLGQAASGDGSACAPASAANDITAKEQAVKCTIENDVKRKIADLVGGPERVQVLAGVTLSEAAQTSSIKRVTRAALLEQNKTTSQSGGGRNVTESKSFSPNSQETTTNKAAGYVKRLALSVTLDSNHVTPAMENAVRKSLQSYVNPKRGDPPPSVVSTKFLVNEEPEPIDEPDAGAAPATGTATDASTAAPGDQAGAVADGAAATDGTDLTFGEEAAQTAMPPRPLLALGAIIVVVLLTAIAMLWRRNVRLAQERKAFEEEFRREQDLFNSWAQQSPDEWARGLDALFQDTPHTSIPR